MLPSASIGIGTVSFLSDDMLNRATALEHDPASEYWLTPVERIRRSTECCGVEMVSLGGLVCNVSCHRSMAWYQSASTGTVFTLVLANRCWHLAHVGVCICLMVMVRAAVQNTLVPVPVQDDICTDV
jgi:hypothetical protein